MGSACSDSATALCEYSELNSPNAASNPRARITPKAKKAPWYEIRTHHVAKQQGSQSPSSTLLKSRNLVDEMTMKIANTESSEMTYSSQTTTSSESLSVNSSKRLNILNEDDAVFEDMVQFLRRLPPKSRENIWRNAAGLKRDDGRTHVLGLITDSEDITSLLCNCVVVFAKCREQSQSILSQKSVKWHLYRATVYIHMKHGQLERSKFEDDKMYFAQILQEYIRFNRQDYQGDTTEQSEDIRNTPEVESVARDTLDAPQVSEKAETIVASEQIIENESEMVSVAKDTMDTIQVSEKAEMMADSEQIIEDLVDNVTKDIERDFHLDRYLHEMSEAS